MVLPLLLFRKHSRCSDSRSGREEMLAFRRHQGVEIAHPGAREGRFQLEKLLLGALLLPQNGAEFSGRSLTNFRPQPRS